MPYLHGQPRAQLWKLKLYIAAGGNWLADGVRGKRSKPGNPKFWAKVILPTVVSCLGLNWKTHYMKRIHEYMFYSISTVVKIITVQGMQTHLQVQKLPEHSLKQITWPAMKSSKDVGDKANALLNTAASHPNPSCSWWAISGKSK